MFDVKLFEKSRSAHYLEFMILPYYHLKKFSHLNLEIMTSYDFTSSFLCFRKTKKSIQDILSV